MTITRQHFYTRADGRLTLVTVAVESDEPTNDAAFAGLLDELEEYVDGLMTYDGRRKKAYERTVPRSAVSPN